jgi:hypothetical protein
VVKFMGRTSCDHVDATNVSEKRNNSSSEYIFRPEDGGRMFLRNTGDNL